MTRITRITIEIHGDLSDGLALADSIYADAANDMSIVVDSPSGAAACWSVALSSDESPRQHSPLAVTLSASRGKIVTLAREAFRSVPHTPTTTRRVRGAASPSDRPDPDRGRARVSLPSFTASP